MEEKVDFEPVKLGTANAAHSGIESIIIVPQQLEFKKKFNKLPQCLEFHGIKTKQNFIKFYFVVKVKKNQSLHYNIFIVTKI